MKLFGNVHFVDPIYFHLSDEVLANVAIDFLRVFQGASFKDWGDDFSLKERAFTAGELTGRTCVEARPGKVVIDFSKAVTQGWACSQIYNAEKTVADEIFYRMNGRGIAFNGDVSIAYALSQEIASFMDRTFVPASVSMDDFKHNSREICRSLRI